MNQADRIQLFGWNAETITIATAALHSIVEANSAETDTEGRALAIELARGLVTAAQANPDHVAIQLDELRPSSNGALARESLEQMLASVQVDTDTLMSRLLGYGMDLTTMLCLLLNVRIDPREVIHDVLYPMHARAVEMLVRLGTIRSAEYLVAHVGLLCWDDSLRLSQLVAPNRDVFAAAARNVWPTLDWLERIGVHKFLIDCDIPHDDIIALPQSAEGPRLPYKDRRLLVNALLRLPHGGERSSEILRSLLAQCSDDADPKNRLMVKVVTAALADTTPRRRTAAQSAAKRRAKTAHTTRQSKHARGGARES